MTDAAAPSGHRPVRLLPGSSGEALVHIGASLALIAVAIAAFIVAAPFGIAVCFLLTLGMVLLRPAAAPVLVLCAFLFQNAIVASFTPLVANDAGFDTVRGANFVILMTAYGAFVAAGVQHWRRLPSGVRRWLAAGLTVVAIVCLYFGIGAVRGDPRDAVVYFRNTVTPLACFHVALLAAALYRLDIGRALAWLGGAAVAYGYCELIFTLDFLALFHGDQYIERQMARQIDTGYWETALKETGFVLRGLGDVMTTSFFNTPFLSDLFPSVWRIAGPNFHPISYAYALALLSMFQLFRGRFLLPVLALPLLVVIGSKGATVLLLVAVAARIALPLIGARLTVAMVVLAAFGWIGLALVVGTGAGDFHVLGFYAGLRGFLGSPLGQGLGIGGNLSTTSLTLDWSQAQANGIASVPVESAVGVMLYQMGPGALVAFAFLGALVIRSARALVASRIESHLFVLVSVLVIGANAVLQEEAFYSPLALGFCLLLAGLVIGSEREGRVRQLSSA